MDETIEENRLSTLAGSSSKGGGMEIKVGTTELDAALPTSSGTYLWHHKVQRMACDEHETDVRIKGLDE